MLSIIIVNFNTPKLTKKCIDSVVLNKTKVNYEIIVIDNGSDNGSVGEFKNISLPRSNFKLIINKNNLGFAKAVNQGIKTAKGKYILLLNSDSVIKSDTLDKLYDFAVEHEDCGVVAPKLLNKDGTPQPSVFHTPSIKGVIKEFWFGIKGSYQKYIPEGSTPIKVDAVVGACFLITPQALQKVGLFDERYFMYFEDLDYCGRVKRVGLFCYYLPHVNVVHLHGESGKHLADNDNQWRRLIASSKIYNGSVKHYLINLIIWLAAKVRHLK